MPRSRPLLLASALFLLGAGLPVLDAQSPGVPAEAPSADPMDAWLHVGFPAADGFDYPVGDADGGGSYTDPAGGTHDGWYVATETGEVYSLGIHTGEDWNGRGGGNTDLGQPVYAMGAGRVVDAGQYGQPWGNIVTIEHVFYENHERRTVRSSYAHLDVIAPGIERGAVVTRRQRIGTIGRDPEATFPAHLHLELRADLTLPPTFWPSSNGWSAEQVAAAYLDPSTFIDAHRRVPVPQEEPVLLLIEHDSYRMRRIEHGEAVAEYRIGFGQLAGRKRLEGDLKSPKGMYFVVQRTRGDIGGQWGPWYGGHWIKINYPNEYDAAWGLAEGKIDAATAQAITTAWRDRRLTSQSTPLGSGIGLHGWVGEWSDDGPRHLSWGCVVMHNPDIEALYDVVPVGTMVVLF